VLYGVTRFIIEFFRGDPRGDVLGLTSLTHLSTSQLISLFVALTSLVVLIIRWRRASNNSLSEGRKMADAARA
jgi:prolipoprotein diacylglyceryltransferase